MGERYSYWAFISYSSKDTAFAKKLHQKLETYRIPRDLIGRPGRDGEPVPKRILPVFRDREELPLSADLGATIEDALRASRYLIVICSRNAARSRWVSEEIRYFKSLGREDRILALMIDGEPHAADGLEGFFPEDECFPPALRYRIGAEGQLTDVPVEPIAGDLRPGGDGWKSAFLKSVAGITGMGYDAFARRQQKRERRKKIAGAVAAALVLAGSLFAWDYYRVQTDYFANLGHRWGVPEGVGPLSGQERAHRVSHYAIESSRRKVRTVRRLNAAGFPRGDEDEFNTTTRQVIYREDGSIQQIDFRDRNDQLVYRQTFGEFRDGPEGRVQFVEFQGEHLDAPFAIGSTVVDSSKSDITSYRHTYGRDGRLISRIYMNVYRQPRAIADGSFGVRYHYEGDFILPWRFHDLDSAGNPAPNRHGILSEVHEYSDLGDTLTKSYLDAKEQPILGPGGWHRVEYSRDGYGNVSEERYLGADGRAVLDSSTLTHLKAIERNDRGLSVESRFFGTDGEPVLNDSGVHKYGWTYDDQGNTIEETAYDSRDTPCLDSYGEHRVTWSYDGRGNYIRRASYGTSGEPVLNGDGYHLLTRKVTERGLEAENAYFGLHEEPIVSQEGYHRIVRTYDPLGNLATIAYYGPEGQPTIDQTDGIHRLEQRFDARGNLTSQTIFGSDEEPALTKNHGVHRYEKVVDDRGYLLEDRFFGVNGEPVLLKDKGAHVLKYERDDRGNLTSESYLGFNNKPVLRSEIGVHSITSHFDSSGRAIGESYFGTSGEPVLRSDIGVHKLDMTLDARGNLVVEEFRGISGEPVISFETKAHRIVSEFDQRGGLISKTYFDTQDQPTIGALDIHRIEVRYDERGNQIDYCAYDTDGEPTLFSPGFHHQQQIFDERNQTVEVSFYGTNGERVLNEAQGISTQRLDFDARGLKIEETYFDADDRPTLTKDTLVHRYTYAYDSRGNLIEQSAFDEGNKPALDNNRRHKTVQAFDPLGNLVETLYFGMNGEPIKDNLIGAHRISRVFDSLGNETEIRLFGLEDEPVTGKGNSHYHLLVQKFDDQSNVLSREYFSTNDAPMLSDQGGKKFHRVEIAYNDLGQEIEYAYFGVNGERIRRGDTTWHRIAYVKDRQGNALEESYFGPAGEPVLRPEGIHKFLLEFDSRGNELSARFLGLNDEPAMFNNAHHLKTYTRDLRGNVTEESVYGLEDEPINYPDKNYHKIAFTYDDRGRHIETRYFDINGRAATTPEGYHLFSKQWGPRGSTSGWAYFDANDQPALGEDGYHRTEQGFDLRGHEIEQAYYGVHGEPILKRHSYQRFQRIYDERGNLTEEIWYGVNGEPAYGWSDCHRHLRSYDERGNLISETRLDIDGEEMGLLDLAGKWISDFDKVVDYERRGQVNQIMAALEKSAKTIGSPGTKDYLQLESLLAKAEELLPNLDPVEDDLGRGVRGISTARREAAKVLRKNEDAGDAWEAWMAEALRVPLRWVDKVPTAQKIDCWAHVRAGAEGYCDWAYKDVEATKLIALLNDVSQHPATDPRDRQERAKAQWRLSERLFELQRSAKELEEAHETLDQMVSATASIYELQPNVIDSHVNYAMALRKQSKFLWEQEKTPDAVAPLERGLEILGAIRDRFPKDNNLTVQTAYFCSDLADLQLAVKDTKAAVATWERAIVEMTKAQELTQKPHLFANVARYHAKLGFIDRDAGDHLAAARRFETSVEFWDKFLEGEPDHPNAPLEKARQHYEAGKSLIEAKAVAELDTAIDHLQTAMSLIAEQEKSGPVPSAFSWIPKSAPNLIKQAKADAEFAAQPKAPAAAGASAAQ